MDDTELKIRPATVADAAILYEWDEKPHVKAAVSNSGMVSFEADWEEELAARDDGVEFFIAEVSNTPVPTQPDVPIGVLQIIDPAKERDHYWGEVENNLRAIDIWIGEEQFLGRGFGTTMMRFAIERCFSPTQVKAILIDPLSNNTRAHKFYNTFGFEFLEQRVFDEESDCFVFILKRARWDAKKPELFN